MNSKEVSTIKYQLTLAVKKLHKHQNTRLGLFYFGRKNSTLISNDSTVIIGDITVILLIVSIIFVIGHVIRNTF